MSELLIQIEDKELEECFFDFLSTHSDYIYAYFGIRDQFIQLKYETSNRMWYFEISRDRNEE